MGESPAVTVLVATYRGNFLGQTLASIAAQTFSDFEVLVLDDANESSCRESVEGMSDPRFVYVGNPFPLRPAMNHKKGIDLARGTRLSILNHDDLWTPNVLKNLSEALDREPSAVAAFSRARVANEAGIYDDARTREVWIEWRCADYPVGLIPDWFALSGANASIPAGPSTLFQTSMLKQLVIPPIVGGMYDAWIGYQVARLGPVYHEDDAVGLWREHQDNLSHTRSAKRTAERIYFDIKLAGDSKVSSSSRRDAVGRLPRAMAAWAKDYLRGERRASSK